MERMGPPVKQVEWFKDVVRTATDMDEDGVFLLKALQKRKLIDMKNFALPVGGFLYPMKEALAADQQVEADRATCAAM